MSTITLRDGLGRSLTHTEMDDNFTNLNNDKYQSGDSPSFVAVTYTEPTLAPFTVTSSALVTNLNADLLDSQTGSYYLDYTNFSNTPTIGNGQITITAGTALTWGVGDGIFSVNQTGNESFTLNHAAVSSSATANTDTLSYSGTFDAVVGVTVNGEGHVTDVETWTYTLPAAVVPNDATITISAGTDLSTGGDFTTDQGTNETITINHAAIGNTPTTANTTLAHEGTFDAITDVTISTQGHFTGYETTTFTLPAGAVPNDGTLTIAGGTDLNVGATSTFTADQASNATITLNHDTVSRTNTTTGNTSPGHSGSFTAVDGITTSTQGHITAVNTKTVTLPAAPNDATITISAGTDLTTGGNFTTDQSTNETITINHDAVSRSNTVNGNTSPGFAGTFTAIDSITTSTQGHITSVNTKTVTMPSEADTLDSVTDRGNTTTNSITVGDLIVSGDLTVSGNTTAINTSTLEVEDINITVAKNATTSAEANGAGLTINGAAVTFNWVNANSRMELNKPLDIAGNITTTGTVDGRDIATDGSKLDTIASGAQVNVATNLSYTASTRVISSSTGTNAELPNVVASGNSGLMTGSDKNKLDGIATGAQVNVGTNLGNSASGTALTITSSTGNNTNLPAATTSAWGVMTDEDKTKLDGIAAGAQVNVGTNLSYTASSRVLASSTGNNATLPNVVASGDSGLMTGADKTKLDGIASGAQVNVGTNISITENTTTVTVASSTGSNDTIAGATGSLAGVVTNTTQTFGGAKTFNSTITASGGINGLTLGNDITGTNFNITGVNQLEISDPGEGIVFTSGSSGSMTLAVVDDSVDNILRYSGSNAVFEAPVFQDNLTTSTGGTYAVDCNIGTHWRTLNSACTISFTNTPGTGKTRIITLVVQQDASGGRVITWPTTNFYWAENVQPPATTTANAKDIYTIQIINNGGTLYYVASLSVRNAS